MHTNMHLNPARPIFSSPLDSPQTMRRVPRSPNAAAASHPSASRTTTCSLPLCRFRQQAQCGPLASPCSAAGHRPLCLGGRGVRGGGRDSPLNRHLSDLGDTGGGTICVGESGEGLGWYFGTRLSFMSISSPFLHSYLTPAPPPPPTLPVAHLSAG